MKKILSRIIIVVLVLVIIAVIAVMFSLDGIVKKGIETVGPKLTGVSVTVDSVHVSVFGGSGKVKKLVVGNPEGYQTPHAISVGTAGLALKIGSVLSDKIVVKSIEVREPEITLEGTLNGILHRDCNLTKILANVEGVSSSTNEPAVQTTPGKPAKKLEVDDFLITGAKLIVSVQGVPQNLTVPIPEIHLTDLGKNENGITAAELTKRVLQTLVNEAVKAATTALSNIGKDVLNKQATNLLNDAKGQVTERLGNLLKKK